VSAEKFYGVCSGLLTDVPFKIAVSSAPLSLVHTELTQIVISGILIGLGDNPCRCIADAQVKHLSLGDQVVQGLHDLGDRGLQMLALCCYDLRK
jgi:hypothetical protein